MRSKNDCVEVAEEATEECKHVCCDSVNTKKNAQLFSCGTLEDNYEVLKIIGTGGFGTVYVGVRKKDNTKVAIKQIAKAKVTYMHGVIILSGTSKIMHSSNQIFYSIGNNFLMLLLLL